MKLSFRHFTGELMLLVFTMSTGISKAQTIDIKQMPATAVRQQGSFFQYAVYINEDKPESDEGAMDAVKSVWLANERVGTVEKVCVTNPQAPAVWQQMNTPEANAVDVPITNIAAADKAWVVITDMTKVIVEGCPDGRNIYTYIIDTENHTAKQFPSTEGLTGIRRKLSSASTDTMTPAATLINASTRSTAASSAIPVKLNGNNQ